MTAFNVLTDPWIATGRGLVSYRALLTDPGKDAEDVVHPRDDVRFFTRMLLSTLTQALFGHLAPDRLALLERIRNPLDPAHFDDRVRDVKDDFELVGRFMQTAPDNSVRKAAKKGDHPDPNLNKNWTVYLLLDSPAQSQHTLYVHPPADCAVCLLCAVPLVYGVQAFAPSGGRSSYGVLGPTKKPAGKPASVRGTPPPTMLIRLASLRQSVWANVLQQDLIRGYGTDIDHPWTQKRVLGTDLPPIGFLEGLFWQPRAFHLDDAGAGRCAACGGDEAPLVEVRAFRANCTLAGRPFYRHPCSATRFKNRKLRTLKYVTLQARRPAWTSLVDLLPRLRAEGPDPTVGPALIVEQFAELELGRARLALLDYRFDKGKFERLLAELWPLAPDRAIEKDGWRPLRDFCEQRVKEATDALNDLRKAVFRKDRSRLADRPPGVFDGNSGKGRNSDGNDVTSAFWQRTESLFREAFNARIQGEDKRKVFQSGLRTATLDIFDEITRPALGDPVLLARTALSRTWLSGRLRKDLAPAHTGDKPQPSKRRARRT